MLFYFEEAFEFISTAIHANENVLVHCLKGMSRSASIVMSYILISSFKLPSLEIDRPFTTS